MGFLKDIIFGGKEFVKGAVSLIKPVTDKAWNVVESTAGKVGDFLKPVGNVVGDFFEEIGEDISDGVSFVTSTIASTAFGKTFKTGFDSAEKGKSVVQDWISGTFSGLGSVIEQVSFKNSNMLGSGGNIFKTVLSETLQLLSSTTQYVDGISETSFGADQEKSWRVFKSGSSRYIDIMTSSPLGSGGNSSKSVYGNLILGCPPVYTQETDPNNRTILNTFVKDMKFLSLTPGMPKYNGGFTEQMVLNKNNTYKTQTPDVESMIAYLKQNGIGSAFASRDRRYYTFENKFDEYYSYLETMLNTLWIQMGLSQDLKTGKMDLFSFFGDSAGSDLKNEYKTALGFYIQGTPGVTESVGNSEFHSGLENDVNAASEEFQRINYITGMGSARGGQGNLKSVQRGFAGISAQFKNIGSTITRLGEGTGWDKGMSVLDIGKNLLKIADNINNTDASALLQQFKATNGMKVRYPALWEDSTYSKSINMDFEFSSPYGDPLSIFHYVYVPFFALLTFALPRQADENGFVSPFFVRADVPGHFTSDLALISDITWTKGGPSGNLFTKDGLPRTIHVSITLSDLYPYLAMTKRISFLSANPSYTVFLSSMAGIHNIYEGTDSGDKLNERFKEMLNRVTGNDYYSGKTRQSMYNNYGNSLFAQARKSYKDTKMNFGSKGPSYSTPYFKNV